eukprot:COSAG02_NODE_3237_length_7121_cov_16.614782_1_plen_32_part_10
MGISNRLHSSLLKKETYDLLLLIYSNIGKGFF